VCYEVTTDALPECGHALCHVCARRWIPRRGTCPTCRAAVQWAYEEELAPLLPRRTFGWRNQRVHFSCDVEDGGVGYTLRRFRGPPCGIVVSGLSYWHPSEYSLRSGDVITHIDEERLTTVSGVARELDRAIDEGAHLICVVLDRRHRARPVAVPAAWRTRPERIRI
jgi:hypothetical protein